MAADRIRYVGKDEHHLPSGRPVAFGEDNISVGTDTDTRRYDVTPDEAQRLITAGVAVAITNDKPAAPSRRQPKTDGDDA